MAEGKSLAYPAIAGEDSRSGARAEGCPRASVIYDSPEAEQDANAIINGTAQHSLHCRAVIKVDIMVPHHGEYGEDALAQAPEFHVSNYERSHEQESRDVLAGFGFGFTR